MEGNNTKKLRDAGLLAGDLPDEYVEFLEGLSQENIAVLLSLEERLKKVGIKALPITAAAKSMPVL